MLHRRLTLAISLILIVVSGFTGFLAGLSVSPTRLETITITVTPPPVVVTSTITKEVTITPGTTSSRLEVPLYHVTRSLGVISANLSDWLRLYDLILMSCNASEVKLTMFGATWCPYCKILKEFFEANYPNATCFMWIDANVVASNAFTYLGYLEAQSGFLQHAREVPQTVVLINGVTKAVVIGAVTDKEFWNKLMSS